MSSGYESVDRIRRSWRAAKPNPASNPAWANTHMDVGVLLAEIDQLRGSLSLAEEGLANYAQENERLRAALVSIQDWECGMSDSCAVVRNIVDCAKQGLGSSVPQT
jgi:hypothetical protein